MIHVLSDFRIACFCHFLEGGKLASPWGGGSDWYLGFPFLKEVRFGFWFDVWLVFSFLFCYVVICFNEELEMEDQERHFFREWGSKAHVQCLLQGLTVQRSRWFKVIVRCLSTCQILHALVRKLVTVWHLVWLPSQDKEGKGESLGMEFQTGLETLACLCCHTKECGHSASKQLHLVIPERWRPGAWDRSLVTVQPRILLSISFLCYSIPGHPTPKRMDALN